VDIPGGGGKLSFNASQLDIFNSADGKPNEMYYYTDREARLPDQFELEHDGKKTTVPVDTLLVSKDEKTGAEILGLIQGHALSSAYIRHDETTKDRAIPDGNKIAEAEKQARVNNQVDTLIHRFKGKEGDDYKAREALTAELTKLGRDAFPELRKFAQSKESIDRGDPKTGVHDLAESVMARQYKQPLPQEFIKEMQNNSLSLFLTRVSSDNMNDLTPVARENFERFIKQVDQPISGFDQRELEAKANNFPLPTPDNFAGMPQISLPPLSIKLADENEGVAIQQSINNLIKTGAARELRKQYDLIEMARRLPGEARINYAAALAKTGNDRDREQAVTLLTEAIKLKPDDYSVSEFAEAFCRDRNSKFFDAVDNSKAYNNPQFIKACNRFVVNGDEFTKALKKYFDQ
jgi:hypothetical protein